MNRPRVGFDARALMFPAGGVRRYVQELYARLPALATDFDIVAVDPPRGIRLPAGTTAGAETVRLPTNLARAALALPAAIRRSRIDLFHAPAYTAPLVGRVPVVVTIHDVSYARRPEFYSHGSGFLRQWFYRRSATLAAHIITDSEFSRSEIVAAYGIPRTRIAVVPLGVGAEFAPASTRSMPGDTADHSADPTGVVARLPTPYVLHVGDLQPRRDVATALRAVIRVRSRAAVADAERLQLVCAGEDCGVVGALQAECAASGQPDVLTVLGPVSHGTLLQLYQNAVALVYPSRYEGFGLPVLEAMACGLPVVAARAGATPEVVGDAGELVSCGDAPGMADAIEALLTSESRRLDLRARGVLRAASFTWDRTARETLTVFRDCLRPSGAANPGDR